MGPKVSHVTVFKSTFIEILHHSFNSQTFMNVKSDNFLSHCEIQVMIVVTKNVVDG